MLIAEMYPMIKDHMVWQQANSCLSIRRKKTMDIKIEPMTREQMHEMYQAFQMDPMIFDDMELFEQVKNYVYNPEKVDMLYDMRMDEEGSHLFAVMLGDRVIGEVGLRHYSNETKECELSVHMMNDSVKGKGYGNSKPGSGKEHGGDNLSPKDRAIRDANRRDRIAAGLDPDAEPTTYGSDHEF